MALKKINFVVSEDKLRDMAYGDTVYAWLLLHSHYNETENHNYIYSNDFTYEKIGKEIGRSRQTVSKRLKTLIETSKEESRGLIYYNPINKVYILPCFRDFEKLDSQTVFNLFRLTAQQKRREELIKTYAWLKNQFKTNNRKKISLNDLINTFGWSKGNEETYNRYKDILTTLQGAGLIKFRTDSYRGEKGEFNKTYYVYQVNDKASQEWLDKNKNE